MSEKKYRPEEQKGESVEENLEARGFVYDPRNLGTDIGEEQEKHDFVPRSQEDSDSSVELLSLPDKFHHLMNYLGESNVIPHSEALQRFSAESDDINRLKILSRMTMSEGLYALYAFGGERTNINIAKRIDFYKKLIHGEAEKTVTKQEFDNWADDYVKREIKISIDTSEITPETVKSGLYRDMINSAMIGSSEHALYKIAKKRCDDKGIPAWHLPIMEGYHAHMFPGSPDSIGRYPELRNIYNDALAYVSRRDREDVTLTPRQLEHKAVEKAADWVVDAMEYNDPSRLHTSSYVGGIEEAVAWARLGPHVRAQLKGMRRKINGIDLHGIKRFVGVSGDTKYQLIKRRIDNDIAGIATENADEAMVQEIAERNNAHETTRIKRRYGMLPQKIDEELALVMKKKHGKRRRVDGIKAVLRDAVPQTPEEREQEMNRQLERIHNRTPEQLLQELEAQKNDIDPKYEHSKSIAQKAIDLHFHFQRQGYHMDMIDWINTASFGTIKRAHRGLQEGNSDTSILSLAIAESLRKGGVDQEDFIEIKGIIGEFCAKNETLKEAKDLSDNSIGPSRSTFYDAYNKLAQEVDRRSQEMKSLVCAGEIFAKHGYDLPLSELRALTSQLALDWDMALEHFTLDEVRELTTQSTYYSIHNAVKLRTTFREFGYDPSLKELGSLSCKNFGGLRESIATYGLIETKHLLEENINLQGAVAVKVNGQIYGRDMNFESIIELLRALEPMNRDPQDFIAGLNALPLEKLQKIYAAGKEFRQYRDVYAALIANGQPSGSHLFDETMKMLKFVEDPADLRHMLQVYELEEIKSVFRKGIGLWEFRRAHEEFQSSLFYSDNWISESALHERKLKHSVKMKATPEAANNLYDRLVKQTSVTELPKIIKAAVELTSREPGRGHISMLAQRAINERNPLFFDALSTILEDRKDKFDARTALVEVRKNVLFDPMKVARDLEFLAVAQENYVLAREFYKVYAGDAWLGMMERLRKVQGATKNAEHDPWEKEFKPLLRDVCDSHVISLDRSEDAEVMYRFISQVGMVNLPKLFRVFVDCARAKEMSDIPAETVRILEQFGIQLKRPDGSWHYMQPSAAFNEVSKKTREFQNVLLLDGIPEGIDTELGGEVVTRLKGNTQWERGDSMRDLVHVWQSAITANPEFASIPKEFQEEIIEAGLLESRHVESKQILKDLDKLFESQEIADGYGALARMIHEGLSVPDPVPWWDYEQEMYLMINEDAQKELQNTLDASPEQWHERIAKELDVKKKEQLVKKRDAMTKSKAREGLEKQIAALRATGEKILSLHITQHTWEQDMVSAMEVLHMLKEAHAADLAKRLCAVHIARIMPQGFRNLLIPHVTSKELLPTLEGLEVIAQMSRQYIYEHYLHADQESEHTGHAPFSISLRKALVSYWQQQPDRSGKFPIELLLEKARHINEGKPLERTNTTKIGMVPARGILRILSGDTGDACYTSRHLELARGEYPDLYAWTYVSNRHESNEILRGSVLGIKAISEDGTPALIARANNPRENFIRTIDADHFVQETLRKVVDTARREWTMRMERKEDLKPALMKQYVAIPLDSSGMSSTNRPLVAQTYQKCFGGVQSVGFINTPETSFNKYPIWNKSGGCACKLIWEIDAQGKETWHGKWDNIT